MSVCACVCARECLTWQTRCLMVTGYKPCYLKYLLITPQVLTIVRFLCVLACVCTRVYVSFHVNKRPPCWYITEITNYLALLSEPGQRKNAEQNSDNKWSVCVDVMILVHHSACFSTTLHFHVCFAYLSFWVSSTLSTCSVRVLCSTNFVIGFNCISYFARTHFRVFFHAFLFWVLYGFIKCFCGVFICD